jgi:hypothetical protein
LIHSYGLLSSRRSRVWELQNQTIGLGGKNDLGNYGRREININGDLVVAQTNADLPDFGRPVGDTLGGQRRDQEEKQAELYEGPHRSP